MDIAPKLSRVRRRELLRLGRKSGDLATALRFHAVARRPKKRADRVHASGPGPRTKRLFRLQSPHPSRP
jgi:hypothetical protein